MRREDKELNMDSQNKKQTRKTQKVEKEDRKKVGKIEEVIEKVDKQPGIVVDSEQDSVYSADDMEGVEANRSALKRPRDKNIVESNSSRSDEKSKSRDKKKAPKKRAGKKPVEVETETESEVEENEISDTIDENSDSTVKSVDSTERVESDKPPLAKIRGTNNSRNAGYIGRASSSKETGNDLRKEKEEESSTEAARLATEKVLEQYNQLVKIAQEILRGSTEPSKIGESVLGLANDLINENRKLTQQIQKFEKQPQKTQVSQPTFAEIVQKQLRKTDQINITKRKPQNIVIIKPRSDKVIKSSEQTRASIMKSIDPERDGINIQNMRKIGGNGILIETNTEEELQKILTSNVLLKKFGIEKPTKKNPRMIIYDVPKEIEGNELGNKIKNQNRELGNEEFLENFSPKFRTGPRRQNVCNWVVEVSPSVRNSLNTKGRVYLGWYSCGVRDFIVAPKCYNCQGLGHIAKFCNREVPTCGHCAQEGHDLTVCPDKNKQPRCAVCTRINRPANHSGNAECPQYQIAREKLINMTDYGINN